MVALCVVWCILKEGYKYMFMNVPALMSAEWETWVTRRSSQETVALKDMVFIQKTSAEKEKERESEKKCPYYKIFWVHATRGNLRESSVEPPGWSSHGMGISTKLYKPKPPQICRRGVPVWGNQGDYDQEEMAWPVMQGDFIWEILNVTTSEIVFLPAQAVTQLVSCMWKIRGSRGIWFSMTCCFSWYTWLP